MQYYSTR